MHIKMGYKKLLIIILITCMLIPLSSAKTEIKIQTLRDHQVQLTLFNEVDNEFLVLERLENISDENGEVSFISPIESNFNLLVFVKKNGETILSEKYLENYNPEENIYLEILPEKDLASNNLKLLLYILLVIFILIIVFISFKKVQKARKPKKSRIIKLSQFMEMKRQRKLMERKKQERD